MKTRFFLSFVLVLSLTTAAFAADDEADREGGCSAPTIVCGVCLNNGFQTCTAVSCTGSVTQFNQACAQPLPNPTPTQPPLPPLDMIKCSVYCTSSRCPYGMPNRTYLVDAFSYTGSETEAYLKAEGNCYAAGSGSGCYSAPGARAGCIRLP